MPQREFTAVNWVILGIAVAALIGWIVVWVLGRNPVHLVWLIVYILAGPFAVLGPRREGSRTVVRPWAFMAVVLLFVIGSILTSII